MEVSLYFHRLLPFALILASSVLGESASDYGFTLELVHRDSPRSPYYNPADTPHQRMANAIRRSISRANRLDPSSAGAPKTPSTTVVPDDGAYLMHISLGTPPVDFLGVADTGSDLIWTKCKPCKDKDCFEPANPPFDPSKSKTYKEVSCYTSLCRVLDGHCSRRRGVCTYTSDYGDNSSTVGTLATETFTLGSTSGRPVSFPKVIFGCGHRYNGSYDPYRRGIIGLGGGSTSLISQMGKATGGKFSHCLVPHSSNLQAYSILNFGANAVVAGRGTVSTRLIQKEENTYYYLTLEAVSVGKTRVEFNSGSSPSADEGNIFIDSGTTLTQLPPDFYEKIEAAVVKQVKLTSWICPPPFFGLCYRATTIDGLGIPTVTFHFKGADVELSPGNTFFPVDDDIINFSLAPGYPSIYGNLAQINYLVGYDTKNSKLSFKPVDCTLH